MAGVNPHSSMLTESIRNARRSEAKELLAALVQGSATMTIGGAQGLLALAVRVTGTRLKIKKTTRPQMRVGLPYKYVNQWYDVPTHHRS
jgi:hypothetical protein